MVNQSAAPISLCVGMLAFRLLCTVSPGARLISGEGMPQSQAVSTGFLMYQKV